MAEAVSQFGIGQPVRRLEDARMLAGKGTYVDDVDVPLLAHAAVVRSTHAHADIRTFDISRAVQVAGILDLILSDELEGLGAMRARLPVAGHNGEAPKTPAVPVLARGRVRYVGEPIAVVLARTADAAREAADLIDIGYGPLPALVGPETALAVGAAQIWEDVPGNLSMDFAAGDAHAVKAAFAGAAHTVSLDLDNTRVAAVPIEPRGAIGDFNHGTGQYTLTVSGQSLHGLRKQIAEDVLDVAVDKVRLLAKDVGGGFGTKNALYPEYILVLVASRRLGQPVKWVAERSESFLADTQGRGQRSRVELALDSDGAFLGLRVDTLADMGAHGASIGPFVPTHGSARTQGGPYRIPAISYRARVALTNTAPVAPYRGAGRPEASYHIERIIDHAANELGIDRIELRRRNLLRPGDLPYATPMGERFDSGDFAAVLDRTLAAAAWHDFADRAAEAPARGRRRGIGAALYLECSGGAPQEYAALAFGTDGDITLSVGSLSTGMGHETSLAQIVAHRLGVNIARVRLRQGDTDATPLGGGHSGSRVLEVAGSAVVQAAAQVVERATALASEMLEAAAEDLVFAAGQFTIVGADRVLALDEVIATAREPSGGNKLDSDATFSRQNVTYPNGCHVAEVEIDIETGRVEVVDFNAVEDFGTIVNPLTAAGQAMGGTVQGIGQALWEHVVYDADSGQLLTGSLMDYALPRAADVPRLPVAFFEDAPTANNPLGVKGAGEAGCVGATPAVVNAVIHALREFGVTHIDMPLSSERVWRAIHGRGA